MMLGKTDALSLRSHFYPTFRHLLKSSGIPNVAVSIPLDIEKVCPPGDIFGSLFRTRVASQGLILIDRVKPPATLRDVKRPNPGVANEQLPQLRHIKHYRGKCSRVV
jgi:hypothetical protein